jgi:hypothetical protein
MTPPPLEPGRPAAADVAAPDVAATVQLMHRRHSWARLATISLITSALGYGAYADAASQGTPPPAWFADIIIAIGALAIVGFAAMAVDSSLLRRRPAAIRAQAAPLAAQHRSRQRAHHYPTQHRVLWFLGWVGMVLILGVAVVSVPAVVDGVAYLAGAEHAVTFDPVSYQTSCDQYSCQTSTDGIMQTGGAGVQATWPDKVPLGQPFQIREPAWKWGLGGALIDSDRTAVIAILVSLLIEGAGVLVIVRVVKLARNVRRHRQQGTTPTSAPMRYIR